MKRTITLDGKKIEYELERKRVKNLNLRIRPDLSIYVSANTRVSVTTIENFITEKKDLILNALDKYQKANENAPKSLEYKNGEQIKLLGKTYELIIVHDDMNIAEVIDNKIVVKVTDVNDYTLKKRVTEQFLNNMVKAIVLEYCQKAYQSFKPNLKEFPQIKFRKMKSRWGSCNYVKGILNFNTRLIYYPKECIELVVYHEFTHFLHHDHSKAFYCELEKFLPDYRERNKILNSK